LAIVFAKPVLAGPAELGEVGGPFDTAEPRVVDADAARKGFEQSGRIAAVEGGLGGFEVAHPSEMRGLVDHLPELGEPGHTSG